MNKHKYDGAYHLGVALSETERQQLEYILEKLECNRSNFIRLVIGFFYDDLKKKGEENGRV